MSKGAEEREPVAAPARAPSLLVALAAIAPLVVSAWVKLVVNARPFWIQFYDPETIYFYDGMRIARGLVPAHADNPGTPLQLISAAIVAFTGRTPLRYEAFLAVAHVAILLAVFAGFLLLQAGLLRGVAPLAQLAVLWTFWLAPKAAERDAIWSPEAFYLLFGAIALVALWRALYGDHPTRRAFAAGAAVGLCIALKFVFLAWLPALVAAIAWQRRTFREPLLALAGAVAGFLAGCAPALPLLPKSAEWLAKLASRSGAYGEGAPQLPDPGAAIHELARALLTSKGWLLWLVVTIVLVFAAARRSSLRERRAAIAFSVVAFLGSYALAVRQLEFRYLLPSALAVALLLVVALRSIGPLPRTATAALAIVAALLLAKNLYEDMTSERQLMAEGKVLFARIHDAIPRTTPAGAEPVVLYSWRVPEPSFALRLLTVDEENWRAIESRYPRDGHFQPWLREVHLPAGARGWDYLVVDRADLPRFPLPHGAPVAVVEPYLVVPSR